MGPALVCFWIFVAVCVVVWLLSLLTKDTSWVDRIWSVIPVVYLWVFAFATGLNDARLVLMASLVTVWGIRLTANFARKGGYRPGGEDYRWAVLRARMPRIRFALFNLFFITIYQNLILLLITLPALTAFEHRSPLTPLDVVLTVAFLCCTAGETLADQQQWAFHRWKAAESAEGRDPRPRFLQHGLFRYSRHPNYFFELAQWWLLFCFGAVAAGSLLQWTVLGAVLLTVLFVGSTVFTEQISKSKYPEYAEYQTSVSPIIPWFARHPSPASGTPDAYGPSQESPPHR